MDKKIVDAVIERSKGLCEVCEAPGTEMHHIISGPLRRHCETKDSVVLLCFSCHRGTSGVHGKNGGELNLKLRKNLERKYRSQGKEDEEVKKLLGGRFYLWS